MSETKQLAEFVVGLKFENLPDQVIEIAKKAIFDCFGVTLAGTETTVGKKIQEYTNEIGGNSQATIIGLKFKNSVTHAALANGTLAHALDYDDIIPNMAGHPSCTIVPVLLSLGEYLELSGKDLLTAYVAGFEVGTRINLGVMDEHYKRGWHNTATVGTIAAAATAAKLLNLNVEATQRAFGMAISMLAGLKRNFGTMTKPLHAGNASRNGVMAAILAKKGFTAKENLLEDLVGGFCEAYCGSGNYNLERITANLNSDSTDSYTIINPGIGFKKYPSCYGTHQALDAMFYLIEENNIISNQVEEVKCETGELFYSILPYVNPKSGLEGKFSLHYCLVRALLDRKVGLAEFADEKVREDEISKLTKRIKVSVHPDLKGKKDAGFGFTVITIKLKDGKILSKKVITPRGEPTNPINREDLVNKYRECAGFYFSNEKDINRSIELLENIENLKNIKELMEIVRKK